MGCCTSTQTDHQSVKSNTQALPPEKRQLIEDNKKTNVVKEQRTREHMHQTVPDDTDTDINEINDNQQQNDTINPKQQMINTSIKSDRIKSEPINTETDKPSYTQNTDTSADNIEQNGEIDNEQSMDKISQKQTTENTETSIEEISNNNIENTDITITKSELLIDNNDTLSVINDTNNNDKCNINEPFDDTMGDTVQNVEIVAERQTNIINELDKLNFLLDKIEDRISNIIDADLLSDEYDSDVIKPLIDTQIASDDSEVEMNPFDHPSSLHHTLTQPKLNTTDDDSD